jgi:putative intracellular protease/amidase
MLEAGATSRPSLTERSPARAMHLPRAMATIAFVLGEEFEDSEFRKPYDGLRAKGHTIDIIGGKAGAVVKGKVDEEVHIDGKLITSRNPDDLPAFTDAIAKQLK